MPFLIKNHYIGLLFVFFALLLTTINCVFFAAQAQPCTTENAAGCVCPPQSANADTCWLLPDLSIAKKMLLDPEWNTETKGNYYLSVATPNVGYGPVHVKASNYFICGTDTLYYANGIADTCPGGTYPKQLIRQIIYIKMGETMDTVLRWAGSMTYHPLHKHMHVDDWSYYSIRIKNPEEPNPLKWQSVAETTKTGFCLMDFGSCTSTKYNDYCIDAQGNALNNPADIPNYGLGGGEYTCGFDQGISAGFLDVYNQYLPTMSIPIPDDLCDGDYYLVVQVDPLDYFLEMDTTNNLLVLPLTLTEQTPKQASILAVNGKNRTCYTDTTWLKATTGDTFLWNTGQTTQTIAATTTGNYWVTITNQCGNFTSDTVSIEIINPDTPIAQPDTVCIGEIPIFTVSAADSSVNWYASQTDTTLLGNGLNFSPPAPPFNDTVFYAAHLQNVVGQSHYCPPYDRFFGPGGIIPPNYRGYLVFDALSPFVLKSVEITNLEPGEITIELRDSTGLVLQSKKQFIEYGTKRYDLDFYLLPGKKYQLGTAEKARFFRNFSPVKFPFQVNGFVRITGGFCQECGSGENIIPNNYFSFYKWQIDEPNYACLSPRIPVMAVVDSCVGGTSGGFSQNNIAQLQIIPSAINKQQQNEIKIVGQITAAEGNYQQKIQFALYNLWGQEVFISSFYVNTAQPVQQNLVLPPALLPGLYVAKVYPEKKAWVWHQKLLLYGNDK